VTTHRYAKDILSDEDAEHLRDLVPDDPVPLPEGHLPCPLCGIAVPDPDPPPAFTDQERATLGWGQRPERFARCAECSRLAEQAAAIVADHPKFAARVGQALARERVEGTLVALSLLGRPTPEDSIAMLVDRLHVAGNAARWRRPLAPAPGLCSPRPWAHVSLSQRASLRAAFALVLRDRMARHQPPVRLVCPTRGCVLCGVEAVPMAAVEVLRRGGPEAAVIVSWRQVTTTPASLGGKGPQSVRGHLCPPCAEAVESEGAVGPSARHRALVEHVRRGARGERKASRLRALLEEDYPPAVPGWGALPSTTLPNLAPWEHVRRVVDRL